MQELLWEAIERQRRLLRFTTFNEKARRLQMYSLKALEKKKKSFYLQQTVMETQRARRLCLVWGVEAVQLN